MIERDVADLDLDELAWFVKTVVAPRPIAWISTVSDDGIENLAPFSSYNYVGASQPVVMFNSPNEATGKMKDTLRNIQATEEFAVNAVTSDLLEGMDRTSARVPSEVSEFDFADVERADCVRIDAPRVAESAVTMECTLYGLVEVYHRVMVLGDVRYFHLSEDVLMEDGKPDARKLDLVARMGGPYYTIAEPVPFEREFYNPEEWGISEDPQEQRS